jgi:hypothetical protein
VTHVSRSIGCEVAKTDVGSVLSVYMIALTPAIKIASRPTQPAAIDTVITSSRCGRI